jgi:predicted RNA methylase
VVSLQTTQASACADLAAWLENYDQLHLDLGTGDGAYALHLARTNPAHAVVGVDLCLDNLAKPARKGRDNLRFVQGDATELPAWLWTRAGTVTINYPYGMLLRALTGAEAGAFLAAAWEAAIEIRINESAATAAGLAFEMVVDGVRATLQHLRGRSTLAVLEAADLRAFPSTWAKRIGYGRPTRTLVATINCP